MVYIVPVVDENNKTLGEIDIDAKTGKNIGGAGKIIFKNSPPLFLKLIFNRILFL